ncbi:MAG: hypothetical protein N2439_15145, partial [Anaerolineae bacterium]|nr:hypothetical protein [Anaerolineae bacterium]
MDLIPLDGEWQLAFFPEAESPVRGPADLTAHAAPTIPAHVPGNVELDLQAAGIIPEPFYGRNIRLLRPYEFYEWWYTREFAMPESRGARRCAPEWDLVFAGLDTIATIWLNGVEIGRAANALIEHRFDVTDVLRPGTNRIVVRLGSAVNQARRFAYDAVSMSWEQREEGLFIRKAPHVWGWDIMPRAVSAGIWRPVWIEERPATAIEQLYYWTAAVDAGSATLGVRFQIRTDAPTTDGYRLRFRGVCHEHAFTFDWPLEFIAGGCRIPVPGARLWWPKGYGEPNLYTVTAQLVKDDQIVA